MSANEPQESWIMFKSVLAVLLTLATTCAFRDPSALPRSRRALNDIIISSRRSVTAIGGNKSVISAFRGGGAAADSARHRPRGRSQIVPITVALVIGFFSVLEIVESLREEAEFAGRCRCGLRTAKQFTNFRMTVGHAHGVFLLSALRLSRGLATLQLETEELTEAVEKLKGDDETSPKKVDGVFVRRWGKSITRFLVSPKVCFTACIMAIVASVTEVIDDMKPGAHHGSVFLALSELNYQVGRFAEIREVGHHEDNEKCTPKRRLQLSLRAFMGPLLFLGAAAVSAMEVYEDTRPGAHHGVAILACAELVENLSRSKIASLSSSALKTVEEKPKVLLLIYRYII